LLGIEAGVIGDGGTVDVENDGCEALGETGVQFVWLGTMDVDHDG